VLKRSRKRMPCGLTFDMSGGTKAKPLGRPLDGGVRLPMAATARAQRRSRSERAATSRQGQHAVHCDSCAQQRQREAAKLDCLRAALEAASPPARKATRPTPSPASAAGHKRCAAGVFSRATTPRGRKVNRDLRGHRALAFRMGPAAPKQSGSNTLRVPRI
jgi:hypothetical protein